MYAACPRPSVKVDSLVCAANVLKKIAQEEIKTCSQNAGRSLNSILYVLPNAGISQNILWASSRIDLLKQTAWWKPCPRKYTRNRRNAIAINGVFAPLNILDTVSGEVHANVGNGTEKARNPKGIGFKTLLPRSVLTKVQLDSCQFHIYGRITMRWFQLFIEDYHRNSARLWCHGVQMRFVWKDR
mmetsp:Transcript_24198/g.58458  ORF Transcript_24198/g.58458 Transcript_24198/m.58458 type:complete len:185 (-) Transcript_24198:216-770(-)